MAGFDRAVDCLVQNVVREEVPAINGKERLACRHSWRQVLPIPNWQACTHTHTHITNWILNHRWNVQYCTYLSKAHNYESKKTTKQKANMHVFIVVLRNTKYRHHCRQLLHTMHMRTTHIKQLEKRSRNVDHRSLWYPLLLQDCSEAVTANCSWNLVEPNWPLRFCCSPGVCMWKAIVRWKQKEKKELLFSSLCN